MRSTVMDAARRVQTVASRATLRKADDKHLWQEVDIDVMASETHTGVERAQSYGFGNYPSDQDEEEDEQKQQKGSGGGGGGRDDSGQVGEQPKGDAAEAIVLYLNGSRSHPVVIAMDDRRHRLKELEQGDTAQFRQKDDRQQFLMHKDGTYLSTRQDKVMRIALVPKTTQDDSQQKQAQGQAQKQQKKKKEYGQKSARDDNKKSEIAIEQNGQTTYSRHGEGYASQKSDSDSSIHYEKDKKKSAQSTELHTHIRFMQHRIWNEEEGNFWTMPCLVKKDLHCKGE
jgi:phage gp45-like